MNPQRLLHQSFRIVVPALILVMMASPLPGALTGVDNPAVGGRQSYDLANAKIRGNNISVVELADFVKPAIGPNDIPRTLAVGPDLNGMVNFQISMDVTDSAYSYPEFRIVESNTAKPPSVVQATQRDTAFSLPVGTYNFPIMVQYLYPGSDIPLGWFSVTTGSCGCSACSSCAYEPKASLDGVCLSLPVGFDSFGILGSSLEVRFDSTVNPGISAVKIRTAGTSVASSAGPIINSVTTASAFTAVTPIASDPDTNAFAITVSADPADHAGSICRVVEVRSVTVTAPSETFVRMTSKSFAPPNTTSPTQTDVAEWHFDSVNNRWSLITGNGLRTETRTVTSSTNTRNESLQVTEASQVVSDRSVTYTFYPWGWEETQEVIAPGSGQLESDWSYWQASDTGADSSSIGRLRSYSRYGGYAESHTYSSGSHAITRTGCFSPGSPASETWTWDGNSTDTVARSDPASQTVIIRSADMTITREYDTSSTYLETSTQRNTCGATFGGMPNSITRPDGTARFISYSFPQGQSDFVTTIDEGGMNNGRTGISDGTRTVEKRDKYGQVFDHSAHALVAGQEDLQLDEWTVTGSDFAGRPTEVEHFGGEWSESKVYNCCGLLSETDRYGITTTYAYDDLKRRIKTNVLKVTTATGYAGLTISQYRYAETPGNGGSLGAPIINEISKTVSNLAGTSVDTWTPSPASGLLEKTSGTVTSYGDSLSAYGRQTVTTAYNGTSSNIQTSWYAADGRELKTWGQLSLARATTYGNNPVGYGVDTTSSYVDGIATDGSGGTLCETSTVRTDGLGRRTCIFHDYDTATGKATATENYTYNAKGQLLYVIDADAVRTMYAYNTKGERTTTAIDLNGNGAIDYGIDQVTYSETAPAVRIISESVSLPVMRTVSKVWPAANTEVEVSRTDRLMDMPVTWTDTLPLAANGSGTGYGTTTTSIVPDSEIPGDWTEFTWHSDGSSTVSIYQSGRLHAVENHDNASTPSGGNLISSVTYTTYDGFNRPTVVTDSRTGPSTTVYVSDICDAVKSITDHGNRTTIFTYDTRGNRTQVQYPDNSITTSIYTSQDQVEATWGSQAYATVYAYDYAGRMLTLRTTPPFDPLTNLPPDADGAATFWQYSPYTGLLTGKFHNHKPGNLSDGPTYAHTAAGRLLTRTWKRGVVTTYGHDTGGRVNTVSYSNDPANTPNLVYIRDPLGRILTVTRAAAAHDTYTFDPNTLQPATEVLNQDTPAARSLSRYIDSLARPLSLQVGTDYSTAYGFDGAGRLNRVWNQPTLSTTKSPVGNATFTYTFQPNSVGLVQTVVGGAHTVTNTWETTRDVLATKVNAATSSTPSSFAYTVNTLGQRDTVGPVLVSGVPVSTYTPAWGWHYNDQGELDEAADHYEFANRAFRFDPIGNRVESVNGLLTDMTGTPNYAANPLNQYTATPFATSAPIFDADGNLTEDRGANKDSEDRQYVWDAENRLIAINKVLSRDSEGVITSAVALVTCQYDHLSRRITKTTGTGGSAVTTCFLYDGWNLIAQYAGTTLKKTYTWGMDLSVSLQGAGGVGGLLAVSEVAFLGARKILTPYYPTFDGNGNVSEYLNSGGSVVAHYEYDPFGNTLASSGSKVAAFAHRFSTKFLDTETGLYYYGYRYYDPLTGRWPSKDPIEEDGGANLYGFVGNDGVDRWDELGLRQWFGLAGNWTKMTTNEDKSRRYWSRKDKTVSMKLLADNVKLNPEESDKWAKAEDPSKCGLKKENKGCCYSVPRIYIVADTLRGKTFGDRFINVGGTVGNIFTQGDFEKVTVKSGSSVVSEINKYKGKIWGFAIFAHGLPNGNLYESRAAGTPSYANNSDVISALQGNGFQLANLFAMHCYSGYVGNYHGGTYDWAPKWNKLYHNRGRTFQFVNAALGDVNVQGLDRVTGLTNDDRKELGNAKH